MDGMDEKLKQRFASIMETQKALANRKQKTLYETVVERIELYIVPFWKHIKTVIPETKIKAFHIAGGLWLHVFKDTVTYPTSIKTKFYEFVGKGQEPKEVYFKDVFEQYKNELLSFGQKVDSFMEDIDNSMKTELAALPTDAQLQEKRISRIKELRSTYQELVDYYSMLAPETAISKPAPPSKGTTKK